MPDPLLFVDGLFAPEGAGDDLVKAILLKATDRAADRIEPSDVLHAALGSGEPRVVTPVVHALEPGVTLDDVMASIDVVNPPRAGPTTFDGRRDRFSAEALAALDELESQLRAGPESVRKAAPELLMVSTLRHLEKGARAGLPIVDLERAAGLFATRIEQSTVPLPPLFDTRTDRLRADELTERAWAVMDRAAARAGDLGYDRVLAPHCLLGLLTEAEGVTEHLFRLQAPTVGAGRAGELISEAFRLGERRAQVELVRDQVSEGMVDTLRAAQRQAQMYGTERIDSGHLLAALLDHLPPRLEATLRADPLALDVERLRRQLADRLRDEDRTGPREVAFRLPTGLLPSDDLTYRLRTEGLPRALHVDGHVDSMTRALFRREANHVLVTGLRGVGKTTLVRELARRAGSEGPEAIGFLARKRFLWVDGATVAAHESKDKLTALLSHVAGRTDVIVCLDGLGPLLRAESGANNKMELRAALSAGEVHLVAVMSDTDFVDLLSADHELLELFTRVKVEEPDGDTAIEMVEQASRGLAGEFQLDIEPEAIHDAVRLSADYVLNERLPAKAIKILRRACEDADYERVRAGAGADAVGPPAVARVVAAISGIPLETIEGNVGTIDYAVEFGRSVVGQERAVATVANELRNIKAGLPDPGKPASVMFFAGLTGVGKTELAKTLAQYYSSSKRLQTYTMENFTQSHTVSGIVGVPPGYVGHEQGGRIVNDLNSDPYCVFLLDEAEKAHPDVWKPFLNLFDEAWIVDQRGVKAFADRAIFILTSNAGHEAIAEMAQRGADPKATEEAVRRALSQIRHRDGQLVFPPEFLARLQRIVVFTPLDEAALRKICTMAVGRMARDWRARRGKRLDVADEIVDHIAREGHRIDRESGFKGGGRVVRTLVADLIRDPILTAQATRTDEYEACDVIEVRFDRPLRMRRDGEPPERTVTVQLRREAVAPPGETLGGTRAETPEVRTGG